MIVTYTLTENQQMTPEQIAEIEAAVRAPIVYDEDSPALTPEAYEAFKRSAIERNRRNQLREKEQSVS